eukprot:5995873-Prymnesium_polylepis.3
MARRRALYSTPLTMARRRDIESLRRVFELRGMLPCRRPPEPRLVLPSHDVPAKRPPRAHAQARPS